MKNLRGFRHLLSRLRQEKSQVEFRLGFFQLNPPLAEEIHLRWMKSLRDEIRLRRDNEHDFIDYFEKLWYNERKR